MLLVRDTIRLIGEIPVQAERARQKKLALTFFFFFFVSGVGGGGVGVEGVSLGSFGPPFFFMISFFPERAPYSIWGTHGSISPEPGHTG